MNKTSLAPNGIVDVVASIKCQQKSQVRICGQKCWPTALMCSNKIRCLKWAARCLRRTESHGVEILEKLDIRKCT